MKEQFKQEVLQNLTENILPYWIDKMVDPRGGFYGRRDGSEQIHIDAPKGAILNARILWTFSAAYNLLHRPQDLEMATRAKREVIDRFYDPQYGGVYWSINADGTPHDPKKQFYAIGFAIYGLSEYAIATGDAEALEYALKLYDDIEQHSRDRKNGGYFEATQRDWQPIEDMRLSEKEILCSRTMNTHLHIIEPYANLVRTLRKAGHPRYQEVWDTTAELLDLFYDKIMKDRGHMGLFFDDDWNRLDGGIISYGHDIEASWLLLETAQILGDEERLQRSLRETKRMAEAALEGRCIDGSMVNERHANGSYDNDKHWWIQAECAVGQIYLYKYHDMPEKLEQAYQTWKYIDANIVDHEGGEWKHSRLGSNGEVNTAEDKAGFWKCPYHNGRMCMEIAKQLAE